MVASSFLLDIDFTFVTLSSRFLNRNHTGAEFQVLVQLLLLALPLLFTLQAFVDEPEVADANHQLAHNTTDNLNY